MGTTENRKQMSWINLWLFFTFIYVLCMYVFVFMQWRFCLSIFLCPMCALPMKAWINHQTLEPEVEDDYDPPWGFLKLNPIFQKSSQSSLLLIHLFNLHNGSYEPVHKWLTSFTLPLLTQLLSQEEMTVALLGFSALKLTPTTFMSHVLMTQTGNLLPFCLKSQNLTAFQLKQFRGTITGSIPSDIITTNICRLNYGVPCFYHIFYLFSIQLFIN